MYIKEFKYGKEYQEYWVYIADILDNLSIRLSTPFMPGKRDKLIVEYSIFTPYEYYEDGVIIDLEESEEDILYKINLEISNYINDLEEKMRETSRGIELTNKMLEELRNVK